MLGCQAVALPSTEQLVSQLSGNISTRQLHILLWRARPSTLFLMFAHMASLSCRLCNSLYCATLWQGNLHKVAAPYF